MQSLIALFAQSAPVVPDSAQGWIGLVMQGGAIVILGYHLLWGLPELIKSTNETHAATVKSTNEANAAAAQSANEAQSAMVQSLINLFRSTLAEDRKLDFDRSAEDRKSSGDRNQALVMELSRLKEAFPKDMTDKFDAMVTELRSQTGTVVTQTVVQEKQTSMIEQQTGVLRDVAKKLEDWPSDAGKVCKAEQVIKDYLADLGIEEKTVTRLLDAKRRQKERETKKGGH